MRNWRPVNHTMVQYQVVITSAALLLRMQKGNQSEII
jgi:hypothetical protein